MKKIVILISIIFISISMFSQKVLLDERTDSIYTIKKWGQNRQNYLHFYVDYGVAVGKPEGDSFDIKYGLSREWRFGLRYKRRVCEHYAMGLDLSISEFRYRFAQYSTNIIPDTLLHEKEYLGLPTVGLEYFNRINFGKRGNKVGNYIDFGAYATYTYSAYHRFWDELTVPINGASKVKTELYKLNYLTDLQWGLKARFAINRLSIWASYRMSDWFNSKFHTQTISAELPRTTVGIEIGFF